MPAISKEQAFALVLGAYVDPANLANNTTFDINSSLTGTDKYNWLFTGSVDLPTIPVIGNLNALTFTLVTTSTDAGNNGVLDYIEGGYIGGTGPLDGSLSTAELNYHTTGRGIFKKLK